ncbi:hypothetical protein NSS71_14430 [Niallia sp. FSL W8-0951]|uniref:hypothetical protein n=1 Tax=Niallia TaxID=2837506 RepID=UPI00203A8A95|nr:hypothetical protein [Niallia circulans]MCM2982055.1 hypothetical protein [Niallia circulans]
MKKITKLGFVAILVLSILSVSSVAFADENTVIEKIEGNESIVNENFGVTDISLSTNDGEVGIFGVGKPTTSHNVSKSGAMYFAGNAVTSKLYTNKFFTGKASYRINVKNNHATKDLKIKLYSDPDYFAKETWTLKPGYSLSAFPTGLKASELYYLTFSAPSNFSGSVQ